MGTSLDDHIVLKQSTARIFTERPSLGEFHENEPQSRV